MSNLLKSKFLLGAMIAASMAVGVIATTATVASADTCTITVTLRVGSRGAEVKCLQAALDHGLVGDGDFGPKTKAAVVAFQTSKGLVADGIFGPKSRAAWMAGGSVMTTTYPAGCTSGTGFSSTTGQPCTGTVVVTGLPAGCTSTSGFSPTTGASCSGSTTTTTTTTTTGPVSAMLATDNPASGYIIANQALADLMHVTFTGSGTVNSVVLQRTGISDQNTLTNVYLFDGNTRLTDGYSFNNSGQLTMNGLGLVVNGSRTVSVKADVASSTYTAVASSLGVTLVSFTTAGATAATTANVAGNQMTVGTGNLASAYINNSSQTVTTGSVNAGTSAYTVWSSPVQVNTRAVWLKGASFRLTGSAPADALQNIKLYVDGVVVGNPATLGVITGSNYAMFDFSASPVSLSTGSHTIDVRADVVKGASYTVTVSLQQASDIVLFDGQVGVNIAVLKSSGTTYVTSGTAIITISAGSASVTVDPVFNSYTNITGGATNTIVAKFKVHGYGEDVKVSTLTVLPVMGSSPTLATGTCTANTDCSLSNVTVYFNGSQVGSSQNWTGLAATTLAYTLGSQMIVPAGTDSYIEIRADLQNTSSVNYTGGTVRADLKQGSSNGQGQTSHTSLNFPTGDVTGTTLTIQTGVLAVSKNTGYANSSVNPNSVGVRGGSFVLQNQSSSESVRVTSFTVALTTDGTTAMTSSTTPALTNFSNLRTSETSGAGATPIQPAASNTFSVDFTLAPGASKVVDVLYDTGSTAASATVVTTFKVTSLGSKSNVSISQNGTGTAVTGQTITLAVGSISATAGTTLTAATSTSQQFVPAAGGATNATKATFKISATGGSATISEMKFTVNSQDFSSVGTYGAVSVGSQTFTPTTAAEAARFIPGDSVQIVASTTNGIGLVTAVPGGTSVTVLVTVAATGTGSALRMVPSTVTGVCVSSDGVTCASPAVGPVAGIAYLTGLNLTVPNGGAGLSQAVLVSYAPVGTNGVATGSTSRVALESVKYSSGGTTTTMCTAAVATCTGQVMTAGTVTAPTMKLVGSNPTLAVSSAGSTLVPGTVQVATVTVTATKGSITLNALPISVSLANVQLTTAGAAANGVIVKDANNNPVTVTNSIALSATTGGPTTILFTGGYQIDTTQTFKIYLQVSATNFNGATVVAHSATVSTGLGTSDLLSWTDTAGNASATTGLDVAGSAVTTLSNAYLYSTVTPGFFYNYPTTTVSVSS